MTQFSLYFFNHEWTIVEVHTDYFENRQAAELYGKQYCLDNLNLVNFVIKEGPPIDIN